MQIALAIVEILEDTKCEPCQFNVYNLPSRQRITKAGEVFTKLHVTTVRSGILEKLSGDLEIAVLPNVENGKSLLKKIY